TIGYLDLGIVLRVAGRELLGVGRDLSDVVAVEAGRTRLGDERNRAFDQLLVPAWRDAPDAELRVDRAGTFGRIGFRSRVEDLGLDTNRRAGDVLFADQHPPARRLRVALRRHILHQLAPVALVVLLVVCVHAVDFARTHEAGPPRSGRVVRHEPGAQSD